MSVFGEKKIITNFDLAAPINGSFSLSSPLSFYKCREEFAKRFFKSTTGFYFSHDGMEDRNEQVANFILDFETNLEIEEKSKFYLTDKKFILFIEHAPFWRECTLKRSLYTILVRCGLTYNLTKKDIEAAIFSNEYAKSSKDAILRFFYGFTKYTGNQGTEHSPLGWRDAFANKSIKEVKKLLVLPPGSKVEPINLGVNCLFGL